MKTNFGTNVDTILIKIVFAAILIVVMLLPISLIKSLIDEREQNQQAVQDEISTKWGGSQHITGPVLVLPYVNGIDKNHNNTISYIYFLPDSFQVNGDIKADERKRTIFKTLVYESYLQIRGNFKLPDYSNLKVSQEQIIWQDAFLLIGISHLQGIKNKVEFNVNGKKQIVQPGVKKNSIIESGLTISIPIDPTIENYDFNFDLSLNGSQNIRFTPVGKETQINLKSDWNKVSFGGDFLPNSRTINESGFDAQWDVFDYNRNYTQMWIGDNEYLQTSTLGIDLKQAIDQYQMTMRSVKYAIMFIVLTFVVFFLVELLSKRKIHPVQYLLVSCALVLFYTLLLAISEHISFGLSYLISSVATTALITVYSTTMFKNTKQVAIMGGFLTMLYIYLYIILLQESMALLFGAIGLFISLATVMFVLRKVDWYKKKENTIEIINVHDNTDQTPLPYIHHKED